MLFRSLGNGIFRLERENARYRFDFVRICRQAKIVQPFLLGEQQRRCRSARDELQQLLNGVRKDQIRIQRAAELVR